MHCENYFCTYWLDNACVLEQVSLDIQGSCQDCVYLSIEEATLAKKRARMQKSFIQAKTHST